MKSSLLLVTCALISASFTAEANMRDKLKAAREKIEKAKEKIPKVDIGPKDELKWCKSVNYKDYALRPAVYEPFSKAENIGYQKVQAVTKEAFEEGNFKLIHMPMADIQTFCPNYYQLEDAGKEDFFGHLLANIARYESGYVNNDAFTEENGNVSKGQLSISYKSQNNPPYKERGCSVITKESDLEDPKSNIKCGLAIISRWVEEDKVLALSSTLGASKYWSTLRSPYLTCINKISRGKTAEGFGYIYSGKVITVGFKDVIITGIKEKMPSCFTK